MHKYLIIFCSLLSLCSCALEDKMSWEEVQQQSDYNLKRLEKNFTLNPTRYTLTKGFDKLYKSPANEIWAYGDNKILRMSETQQQLFKIQAAGELMVSGDTEGQLWVTTSNSINYWNGKEWSYRFYTRIAVLGFAYNEATNSTFLLVNYTVDQLETTQFLKMDGIGFEHIQTLEKKVYSASFFYFEDTLMSLQHGEVRQFYEGNFEKFLSTNISFQSVTLSRSDTGNDVILHDYDEVYQLTNKNGPIEKLMANYDECKFNHFDRNLKGDQYFRGPGCLVFNEKQTENQIKYILDSDDYDFKSLLSETRATLRSARDFKILGHSVYIINGDQQLRVFTHNPD